MPLRGVFRAVGFALMRARRRLSKAGGFQRFPIPRGRRVRPEIPELDSLFSMNPEKGGGFRGVWDGGPTCSGRVCVDASQHGASSLVGSMGCERLDSKHAIFPGFYSRPNVLRWCEFPSHGRAWEGPGRGKRGRNPSMNHQCCDSFATTGRA